MDIWGAITGAVKSDPVQNALTAGSDAAINRFIGGSTQAETAVRQAEPAKAAEKVQAVTVKPDPLRWGGPVVIGIGSLMVAAAVVAAIRAAE